MGLGAVQEDVPFDHGVAETLITAFRGAASAVEGQAGSRSAWRGAALTDFRGRFSELFAANARLAAGDAVELCARLREVATAAGRLQEEARKEQQRREAARAWQRRHDARSNVDKIVDFFTDGDDPPVGPPAGEPSIEVSPGVNRTRQTPGPGSGGGGRGGLSSARPSALRTFAARSAGADDALRSRPGTLQRALEDFSARCRWGRLEATGVPTGFTRWLAANDDDVRWARVVADAFAAAGGEGAVSTVSDGALRTALAAAGVRATRTDLVIDPPQAYGAPPTTGYANDPVNTSTGGFLEREVDLAFPGAAALLVLERCYHSFDRRAGAFGPGWSSAVESGLVFDAVEARARFRFPDGREVVFPRRGDGWDRALGEDLWLESTGQTADCSSAGWRVSDNEGRWWDCAETGALLGHGVGDAASGVALGLERDADGCVVGLQHARGRSVRLHWGVVAGADRVVAATGSDGREVRYAYDDEGRLTAASGPRGSRSYRWEQDLVVAVVDPDGVVEVENAYDAQRRVVRQRSPHGRVTRFAYVPGRVTVVSDEDGTRSNTWIADERGRLVGVVDAEDHRQSTSYDAHGHAVLVTERDGAVVLHEHDERGRRVRTVTPSGADVTWGHDALDRVTTVVTEQGAVTRLAYTGTDRHPSTIIDPEGGVTELAWEAGLLVRVVDPTGVTVSLGHDEHGDLVSVTDAVGNVARTERDATGRVTAAVSPSGRRTTFEHDPVTGLLAAHRDPSGATWRYEHTAAGRLSAVVDPLGGRTTVEHGEHGEAVRTLDPLGRAVVRHLDDLGNLARVDLPSGASWQFAHDAVSRLVATTDPTGAVWRQEHDAAGRLVATVDPTGVRRGVAVDRAAGLLQTDDGHAPVTDRFDPLGRLTSAGQTDGSAAVLTYDRCGRVVEALDAEGGLTRVRRDAAGRPVQVTSPGGAVTEYAYDACGRLAAVRGPSGGRTTIAYDADGAPVRQTLPTGDVARTRYDVCGRVVRHSQPGAGTSSWEYDVAGRVVASRDPQHGRRRYRYDAAGQLVEVVDGNGGTTRYRYDQGGRAVEVTGPLGGVVRRAFDDRDRCVAETDPLGRTTRAGYDAAGRLLWQQDPDGTRTTWTYDSTGRPASMAVDGRTVTTLRHDPRRRSLVLDDLTGERPSRHELVWDRRGNLVRRSRDGRDVTWTYDADGRRTSLTTPDGTTTRYGYDAAGRVLTVDHPLLGRAVLERDEAGRTTAVRAGDLDLRWEHRDGAMVSHTVEQRGAVTRTDVERDDDGRVVRVRRRSPDGETTTDYAHDAACQLQQARTRSGDTESVTSWRYDAAGRLVEEVTDGAATRHAYDAAGQLLSTDRPDGGRVVYAYDALGRRTRATDGGRTTAFTWSPTGTLSSVTTTDGDEVRRTGLRTDALGELASVDGTELFWDTASFAGAPVLVGDVPVTAVGPLTGIGTEWTSPGWRTARTSPAAGSPDPWSPGAGTPAASLGAASAEAGAASALPVALGPGGELRLGGLEWLGARVYDPGTRAFLSVDPLDPVPGAGWAGNPYSYAGNDPLHALDPSGLRPVTDAELQAYRDGNGIGGAAGAVGDWAGDNWEYLAGGAMVIAGGALMFTGVGGPVGMMLMSAGADTIVQKAMNGEVDWGQVAISGAFGAFSGVGVAARAGVTSVLGQKVLGGAVSGTAAGAVGGAYGYLSGPGPHTVGGAARATSAGAALGGVVGAGASGAGHGLETAGKRVLASATPVPVGPADDLARGPAVAPAVVDAPRPPKPLVIGENMQRVKDYADQVGGHAYRPWRNDPFDVDLGMRRNERMIKDAIRSGREIIDIGPDFARREAGREPSIFYGMERRVTDGYGNYTPVFKRTGRLEGGVPGLDQ